MVTVFMGLIFRTFLLWMGIRLVKFAFFLYEHEEKKQRETVQKVMEKAWRRINAAPRKISAFAKEALEMVVRGITHLFGPDLFSWRTFLMVTAIAVFITDGNDGLTTLLIKPKNVSLSDEARDIVTQRLFTSIALVSLGVILFTRKYKLSRITGAVLIIFSFIRGFVSGILEGVVANPGLIAFAMNLAWLITPLLSLLMLVLIRIFLKLLLTKHSGFFWFIVAMSAVIAFILGSLVWLSWILFAISIFDPNVTSWVANFLIQARITNVILSSALPLLYSMHLFSTSTVLFSLTFLGIFMSGVALMLFRSVWPCFRRIAYATRRFKLADNRALVGMLGLVLIGTAVPALYPILKFVAKIFGIDLPGNEN